MYHLLRYISYCDTSSRSTHLFMAALSLATAANTSVIMLPGPIAFTRTLCGANASAIHLHPTAGCALPDDNASPGDADMPSLK